MKLVRTGLLLAALAVGTCHVAAQGTPDDGYGPQAAKAKEAKKQYDANLKRFKDNADVLVLPGLVANKKTKLVEILAESTGLGEDEAVEFFIIAKDSSQGYESLLWSHAKPSDIHKALEFIGIPGGAPRNPMDLRFWPKGELVKVSVEVGEGQSVPLMNLIFDKEADDAMEDRPFIFTGSMTVPDRKDKSKTIYVADQYQPKAILPAFNSAMAVLEPTWQASKGEAYQTHVVNQEFAMDAHDLLTLVIEPAAKDGTSRVKDLTMTIENNRTFKIADAKGKQLTPDTSVKAALDVCLRYLKSGQIPFVTLRFSDTLKLFEIRQLCNAMVMLDQPNALRIEPPIPGRLYYRSFLTSPAWKDQTQRMNQSWELHLKRKGEGLTGTMAFYDATWPEGSSKAVFTKRTYPADTAESVRKRLDLDETEREKANKASLQQVLMVFAPADLAYGTLLKFLGPALKTHKTVHLFLDLPESQ